MADENVTEPKVKKRKLPRRFEREDAPPDLIAAECSPEFWPTRMQWMRWEKYLDIDMGVTPEGWFYGRCPIHDLFASRGVSAMISFNRGVIRCLDEDERCHPGRKAISLNNAMEVATRKLVDNNAETN